MGQALLGNFKNSLNVLTGYAGKPLHEIIHSGSVFQIFKKCSNRNAGSLENRSAAQNFRVRADEIIDFHNQKIANPRGGSSGKWDVESGGYC